jgi:hypothetical protein
VHNFIGDVLCLYPVCSPDFYLKHVNYAIAESIEPRA